MKTLGSCQRVIGLWLDDDVAFEVKHFYDTLVGESELMQHVVGDQQHVFAVDFFDAGLHNF